MDGCFTKYIGSLHQTESTLSSDIGQRSDQMENVPGMMSVSCGPVTKAANSVHSASGPSISIHRDIFELERTVFPGISQAMAAL